MVNKNIFSTEIKAAPYNTANAAGGRAYKREDLEALCQYVVTGCFGQTYYANAKDQFNQVQTLIQNIPSEQVAKVAVYGAERGKMKDMPVYCLAVLFARKENELVRRIFNRVIRSAKTLTGFVQIIRSGALGRKSFGTVGKKLIQNWLNDRSGQQVFNASIGQGNPSIADVIKMVHPSPVDKEHEATFAYLIGKEYNFSALPESVQFFEQFKKDGGPHVPQIPFRALTNCDLSVNHWCQIAESMPWNTLRMNLNVLNRNGVFKKPEMVEYVAAKLRDEDQIRKWNAFPFQILTAYKNTAAELPREIGNALQDALEIATENVPDLGKTIICVDTSASMGQSVTGDYRGTVSCLDAASLFAASLARKNDSRLVLFDFEAREAVFNPRDSIASISAGINAHLGGGTSCGSAMSLINAKGWSADNIVFISDNESWCDFASQRHYGYYGRRSHASLAEGWATYQNKSGNRNTKLTLIDITPTNNTQAQTGRNVLNVGGFSDALFDVLGAFHTGNDNFTEVVMNTEI